MQHDCNYPQTPTYAHSLYKITNLPYTSDVLYVSAINQHSRGDIITEEYKISTSNSHIQYYKHIISAFNISMWCCHIIEYNSLMCYDIYTVCGYMHRNIQLRISWPKMIKSLHNTPLHETRKYTVAFGSKPSIPAVSVCTTTHSGTSEKFI